MEQRRGCASLFDTPSKGGGKADGEGWHRPPLTVSQRAVGSLLPHWGGGQGGGKADGERRLRPPPQASLHRRRQTPQRRWQALASYQSRISGQDAPSVSQLFLGCCSVVVRFKPKNNRTTTEERVNNERACYGANTAQTLGKVLPWTCIGLGRTDGPRKHQDHPHLSPHDRRRTIFHCQQSGDVVIGKKVYFCPVKVI